jgi:glutamine cyclotransferase
MLVACGKHTAENVNIPTTRPDIVSLNTYAVVQAWPHNPGALTRGLVFHQGRSPESTGPYRGSIIRLDAATGRFGGVMDPAGLAAAEDRNPATDVRNGIAYDAEGDRRFVTGRRWSKLFGVRLRSAPDRQVDAK